MNSLFNNLAARMRLLKTALTSRFVYHDIISMARKYGMDYGDVVGNRDPLSFSEPFFTTPGLNRTWKRFAAEPKSFTPPNAPAYFNSEPSVSRFLEHLAVLSGAETIIELGSFVGWTTAHLANAVNQNGRGHVFAVDPSQAFLDATRANLARHGLEECATLVKGLSTDRSVLEALPPKADIIFLDTCHSYPATLDEIHLYAPRLKDDGYFVLHDSVSAPGVRRSLIELQGFSMMTFATERSNGVTVLQKGTS